MDEQERIIKKFARYQKHPVEYCREILGIELNPGQADVLDALVRHNRVGVKSGNGWGKSFTLASASLWHFDCFPNSKTPTTSGSARQVRYTLWSEINKLAHQSKLKASYVVNNTSIERQGHPSWYILGFSSDEQGRVEGFHAENQLFILDECRTISDEVILAAFKCCTEPGNRILAGSIPGGSEGMFYKIFHQLRTTWKTFSYPTAKFKHGRYKALYPERVSQESIDEKLKLEGESSPFFRSSVLAEFMQSEEDSLIPLNLIQKARENDLEPLQAGITWGGDVARYGRDTSCLCRRQGPCILGFMQKRGMDTISVSTWFELEAQGSEIAIDECGVGAGVIDALRARQISGIVPVNVAQAAHDPEKYLNLRAELYWKLRTKFERAEIDLSRLELDVYDRLKTQLSGIKYKFSKGKLQIESKEDSRKRGIPSPDMADALMLSFATESQVTWTGSFAGQTCLSASMWDNNWIGEDTLAENGRW